MVFNNKKSIVTPETAMLTADELLANMVEDYTGIRQKDIADVRRGIITQNAFLKSAEKYLRETYGKKAAEEELRKTLEMFEQYIFGYYKLQKLLDDKEISDIRMVSPGCIRCKRLGERETTDIVFDKDEYNRFIEFVASKNQINTSNVNAIQTFTDAKSHPDYHLRFTLAMPILNSVENAYLHIRKFPRDFPEMEELVKMGILSQKTADYLVERAKSGSVFICGKSGAGKSYLLNALKEKAISPKYSCLVIQENDELTTKSHPEMMFMHPLINRGESKVEYTLDDISTAALLMDFDYFIIGETKGEEALDLLNASFTGHICYSTGHGESSQTALDKVVVNAMKKNNKLSKSEILKMLLSFRTIVFMENFKVAEISEAEGWLEEEQRIRYRRVI